VEDPHLVLQVSAQEVVKVVHQERCNAVASVAALMGQKTVTAIVTAPPDQLPAVNVVKASQESVLQLAAGSVQLEWPLFVLVVEAVLRQEVAREATVPQLEADLVATDLLVEAVQEETDLLVVAVALVETDLLVEAVREETDLLVEVAVALVETDLLVEEVVQEAIARLVVAVALVETVHHLQEGCLLQCPVEHLGQRKYQQKDAHACQV